MHDRTIQSNTDASTICMTYEQLLERYPSYTDPKENRKKITELIEKGNYVTAAIAERTHQYLTRILCENPKNINQIAECLEKGEYHRFIKYIPGKPAYSDIDTECVKNINDTEIAAYLIQYIISKKITQGDCSSHEARDCCYRGLNSEETKTCLAAQIWYDSIQKIEESSIMKQIYFISRTKTLKKMIDKELDEYDIEDTTRDEIWHKICSIDKKHN